MVKFYHSNKSCWQLIFVLYLEFVVNPCKPWDLPGSLQHVGSHRLESHFAVPDRGPFCLWIKDDVLFCSDRGNCSEVCADAKIPISQFVYIYISMYVSVNGFSLEMNYWLKHMQRVIDESRWASGSSFQPTIDSFGNDLPWTHEW